MSLFCVALSPPASRTINACPRWQKYTRCPGPERIRILGYVLTDWLCVPGKAASQALDARQDAALCSFVFQLAKPLGELAGFANLDHRPLYPMGYNWST
jgi:hypothetical protein